MHPLTLPADWPHRSFSRHIACKPHLWHVQEMGTGPLILLLHGAEDPANPAEACASLCEGLRATGAVVGHQQVPGAGYAWDFPQLGAAQEVMLPAPGLAGRVAARPWPAMAAQTAATVAGFFALNLAQ